MELYYVESLEPGQVGMDPEESFHCVRVMRHRAGDRLTVTDGRGVLAEGVLTEADPRCAVVSVERLEPAAPERGIRLHVAAAPTKNIDRFEWFLEKGTELGMAEVTPLLCARSERKAVKEDRVERILRSASRQSLRCRFPVARPLTPFRDLLAALPEGGLRLIAYCGEEYPKRLLREVLQEAVRGRTEAGAGVLPVTVLIGPEGDFSPEEVAAALQAGFVPVTFGTMRMRAETAAVFAVAAAALLDPAAAGVIPG